MTFDLILLALVVVVFAGICIVAMWPKNYRKGDEG